MRKFKNIKPIRRRRIGRPPKKPAYVVSSNAWLGIVPTLFLSFAIVATLLLRYNLTLSIPTLSVPSVSFPKLTIPTFTIPEVSVPKITPPTITVPQLSVPKISVPSVEIPRIQIPSVPNPRLSLPTISLPSINLPRISVSVNFAPIFDALGNALRLLNPLPILQRGFDGLVSAGKVLGNVVISLVGKLDPRPLLSFVAQIVGHIGAWFFSALRFVFDVVAAVCIAVYKGVTTVITFVFRVLYAIFLTIVNFFLGIYSAIAAFFQTIGSFITAQLTTIATLINYITPPITWVFETSAVAWKDFLRGSSTIFSVAASSL